MKALATPAGPSLNNGARPFSALFGAFLGITLLKFGNPPLFESFVTTPADLLEFVIVFPWPIRWAYSALAVVTLFGFLTANKSRPCAGWLALFPLGWLHWHFAAASRSVDPSLSWPTVWHF